MKKARSHQWDLGAQLLPASRLVPSASRPRRVASALAFAVAAFLVASAAAPWRQNIGGAGTVIAYDPNERLQKVEATISGRVIRWYAMEGDRVDEGDLLVELQDNDPSRAQRLGEQLEAAEARLRAYEAQVTANEERVASLREAQSAQLDAARAAIASAQQSLASAEQNQIAAEARLRTAETQLTRIERLASDGLSSQRERELALLERDRAQASKRSADASVTSARAGLRAKRADLADKQASTTASLASATASVESARTSVASARSSLASIRSRVAQQSAQQIRAPRDGVIQRILAQQGGEQVSRGSTLAYLVPDSNSRAAAVYVDGNDAAMITPGRQVRLQFEGWPAVQFAGWPSVAVGTFGGRVSFVDPSGDGEGNFRVVVRPDDDDEAWPSPRFLRQGTRVKGWVLLDEVSVGFEIWRQLNGFPPSYRSEPGYEDGSS